MELQWEAGTAGRPWLALSSNAAWSSGRKLYVSLVPQGSAFRAWPDLPRSLLPS